MLFRRHAEALSQQNWSVIIIEVLAIVVGIFIGQQVEGWNDCNIFWAQSQ